MKFSRLRSLEECRGYKSCAHYIVRRFETDFCSRWSAVRSCLENFEIDFYQRSLQLHRIIDRGVEAGDLRTGKLVLTHLVKLGSDYRLTSIWNKVVAMWCKRGEIGFAQRVFDEMPRRDTVSYNTFVSNYVRGKCEMFEVFRIYSEMVDEGVKPNNITFAALIGACDGEACSSSLRQAFHGLVLRLGLSCDEYVGSAIVDGYAKGKRLDDAVKAFDEIAVADLVSWNILIDGCAQSNCKIRAFKIFDRMMRGNVEFDEFTLTSVVKTCTEPGDLSCGMQIHCCAEKLGFGSATAVGNSLVTMYARCEQRSEAALKVFQEIRAPNVISWTAIIAGLMQDGQNTEAIDLYKRMLTSGLNENQFTFASIIPAIGHSANFEQGRQIHGRTAVSCFGSDVTVNNALIDMYSKCGSLDDAQLVFKKMGKHDVVSCTTMITALGQHGMGKEALQILKEMTVEKLQPDSVTFLSCLSACSHSGLLHEGITLFRSMLQVYDVKPRKEHFSCVVDMLGRAGRLSEAETFIRAVGVESDVLVWEALLGACRLHGEMMLGQKSAKKIMELKPTIHGPYILLSDMYAAKGMWQDKRLVRERLAVTGMKKEPGGSWIH